MKYQYEGIIFDDVVLKETDGHNDWTRVCDKCAIEHNIPLEKLDEWSAQGICAVEGCQNEAEHNVDFEDGELREMEDVVIYDGLPSICYGTLPSTKETIIIKKGESGYFPTYNQGCADELNEQLGVTKAQAEAMFTGSLFGWHVEGANPKNYHENGVFDMTKIEDK